jgi:hypothetical protein
MTSRPSTAAPILAVLVIVLVTLGAYVGLYFSLLSDYRLGGRALDTGIEEDIIWRVCEHRWQMQVFAPAAQLESSLRGQHVELISWSDIIQPDQERVFD